MINEEKLIFLVNYDNDIKNSSISVILFFFKNLYKNGLKIIIKILK